MVPKHTVCGCNICYGCIVMSAKHINMLEDASLKVENGFRHGMGDTFLNSFMKKVMGKRELQSAPITSLLMLLNKYSFLSCFCFIRIMILLSVGKEKSGNENAVNMPFIS